MWEREELNLQGTKTTSLQPAEPTTLLNSPYLVFHVIFRYLFLVLVFDVQGTYQIRVRLAQVPKIRTFELSPL